MKRNIILLSAALGLLTACDPIKDEATLDIDNLTSEQLLQGATFEQFSGVKNEDGSMTYTPAADGNYIKYNIPAVSSVQIYYVKADGSQSILSTGASGGMFAFIPARGSDPNQTVYFRYVNQDGKEVTATKDFTLAVASELTPEMRLLASDSYGHKVWTWDTEFREDEGCWGNMGYVPGDGESFVNSGNGIWWGAAPEVLAQDDQRKNANFAPLNGEEDRNAYMEFYDDGSIKTYDANGKVIREGKFEVEGWTGERNHASIDGSQANWSYGTFKTTEGAILFPFQINGGGYQPTEFELMQLDASNLKLIYAAPGTGGWAEATWWAFKSTSDPEAALTNFGTKTWTWDVDWRPDEGCWGNLGYAPGDGASFVKAGNGIWWGAAPEVLAQDDQRKNANFAPLNGEEDRNAYMTFDRETSTIKSYNAAGEEIRGGKFEIQNWQNGKRSQPTVDGSQPNWAYGTLHTDAGSILFPFKINGGGEQPTDFEIMQITETKLKLIYAAPGTGGWGEATWWAFKKK